MTASPPPVLSASPAFTPNGSMSTICTGASESATIDSACALGGTTICITDSVPGASVAEPDVVVPGPLDGDEFDDELSRQIESRYVVPLPLIVNVCVPGCRPA